MRRLSAVTAAPSCGGWRTAGHWNSSRIWDATCSTYWRRRRAQKPTWRFTRPAKSWSSGLSRSYRKVPPHRESCLRWVQRIAGSSLKRDLRKRNVSFFFSRSPATATSASVSLRPQESSNWRRPASFPTRRAVHSGRTTLLLVKWGWWPWLNVPVHTSVAVRVFVSTANRMASLDKGWPNSKFSTHFFQ